MILPFKRSESRIVKDDSGHEYCIHQDWKDKFNRWVELGQVYWDELPDITEKEFYILNELDLGELDFESYMLGCNHDYFYEIATFLPE